MVAATTTLAEGVDLPFRVTVIVNWLTYSGDGLEPMTATLFANIAGRAGRATSFTYGDTILFDNPVGDPEFTHPGRRARVQAGFLLADQLPHLTSAFESAQEPQRNDLRAALASQLLAAIPESPGEDDLVGDLLSHTLVGSRIGANGRRSVVAALLEETRTEVLGGDDVALAVANSLLSLTPLGVGGKSDRVFTGECRQAGATTQS